MLETQVNVVFKDGLNFRWKMYLSEVPLCLFSHTGLCRFGFSVCFPPLLCCHALFPELRQLRRASRLFGAPHRQRRTHTLAGISVTLSKSNQINSLSQINV